MNKFFSTLLLCLLLSKLAFCQNSIKEYVHCLEQHNQSPIDYILKSFETHDIIIIGERDHREATQYELIHKLLKDERFIKQVGHVYTEVGVTNMTAQANAFIKGGFDSEEEFETTFLELYHNLDFNPIWDKVSMANLLKELYRINKDLEKSDQITIGFTDVAFDWKQIHTHEEYMAFVQTKLQESVNQRDSTMAMNFISLYEQQKKKKALYVLNRPHAINLNVYYNGTTVKRTSHYLKEKYGDQVKVIAFNWYNWIPSSYSDKRWGTKANHVYSKLTAQGRWDGSFEILENRAVGFDIMGTPFGLDEFEFGFGKSLLYQDIIDGLIFYKPFYEFQCTNGLPGIFNKKFAQEWIRKEVIVEGAEMDLTIEGTINDFEFLKYFDCTDYTELKKELEKVLIN